MLVGSVHAIPLCDGATYDAAIARLGFVENIK
jgi:hypothetical protein